VPEHLHAAILAEAARLYHQCAAPQEVRDTAQETYLQQLKQAYNAGILTRSEYERKASDWEHKKGLPPRGGAFDVQQALHRLADLPQLLEQATAPERLAVVKSLFHQVWVENSRIASLTPRADVEPVLTALVRVLDGVPDGARTHNILSHSQALCH
jgi:hypothetical protein